LSPFWRVCVLYTRMIQKKINSTNESDIDFSLLWMEVYGLNDPAASEKVIKWVNLSKDNYDLFNRIKEEEIAPLTIVNDEEKLAAWAALKEKLVTEAKLQKANAIVEKANAIVEKANRIGLRINQVPKQILAIASILLFVVVSFIIYSSWMNSLKEKPITESNTEKVIESNIVLITSDGRSIIVSKNDSIKILDSGVKANINGSKMEYAADNAGSGETKRNKLVIPRGATFEITLSDGTQVWLNAESSLEYPIAFNGKKRNVILNGEAYFKVVKNEKVPFEVSTGDQVISVLGTSFNVSAYQSDPTITTTLVEGKVALQLKSGASKMLTPNMQGIFNVHSNNITTQEVDPTIYTSWKEGLFVFEDQSLEAIMLKLARAYNIDEVLFEDENLRSHHYTVQVTRYEKLEQVLDLIQTTNDLRYSLNGNKLTIRKR
jgi:transmembrane sensor